MKLTETEIKNGQLHVDAERDAFSECTFLKVRIEAEAEGPEPVFRDCAFIACTLRVPSDKMFSNCQFYDNAQDVIKGIMRSPALPIRR